MGSTCCNSKSSKEKDMINIELEKLISDYDKIHKTKNPFFNYTLKIQEKLETKFISSKLCLVDFINKSTLFGSNELFKRQIITTYTQCKYSLSLLLDDNEKLGEIWFLNILMFLLSYTKNNQLKKEQLVYNIIKKNFDNEKKNFPNFIINIKALCCISAKIAINFIFIYFVYEKEDFSSDLSSLFLDNGISNIINNNPNNNKSNNILDDDYIDISYKNKKPELKKSPTKINTDSKNLSKRNTYIDTKENINPNESTHIFFSRFKLFYSNYIKIITSFEKYNDKLVSIALEKFLFKKSDLMINKEDKKEIVSDVVQVFDLKKLFDILIVD